MQYAKAIIAGLIALVGGIAVGYTDDSLTRGEFWAAAAAATVALGSVFRVRNEDADEAGAVSLLTLAVVAIAVVLILGFFGINGRVS